MATYQDWEQQFRLAGFLTAIGATILITFPGNRTFAQITPDATLGTERSVVTPNINIRGLTAEQINGGEIRGVNLFHSFQEFNVGNGQRVYFANPTGIENILSRVTGNNLSKIFGTLGVDGGANLFLLNPNGIIFGQNSRLDISGSFVASTANSLVFDNGLEFSATNPQAPPILTIKVTPGLQYGTNQPAATIANSGNLAVGQNLTLAAGNLDLQGQIQAGGDLTLQAQDTVKVRDSVVNPFIAEAGGKLLVQGNQIIDIFALNHPNSGFFSGGDMVLRSPNAVMGDAHYTTGGNFRIEKLDGNLGDLYSPNDPIILSDGNVTLGNYRGASLHILAGGSVTLATVEIIGTDSLANTINPSNPNPFLASLAIFQLSNGTEQRIEGNIQPTLDIRAGIDWTKFTGGVPQFPAIIGGSIIPPPVFGRATSANIRVNGNIIVSQPNGLVLLTNQYQRNTALSGNIEVNVIRTDDTFRGFFGNSSSVIIDSRGNIELFGNSLIRTSSATGNAGNISLIANGSFLVRNGGLSTRTTGQGDAGDVLIQVGEAVSLTDNSFILTFANSGALGNGGDINIQSGSLALTNGSKLQTFVEAGGQGDAGDVNINVRDTITIAGFSGIFTDVGSKTIDNAGDITVQARTLDITSGGQISTASNSTGKTGDISIATTDSVNLSSGGSIITFSTQGNSGNLSISTRQLNVRDELTLLTTGSGAGNAGELSIIATDSVNVSNLGVLTTATGVSSTGNSGNLFINTGRLNVSNGKIDVTSFGRGNSGNLSITAADSVNVSDGSFLTTGTEPTSTGNAGTLSIFTRQLEVKNRGIIETVSAGAGTSGDLLIKATDSINIVNQSLLSASPVGRGTAGNTLIETGKLSIRDGSGITSSTFGARDGGNLTIRATDFIEVVNFSKLSSDTFGSGNAGDLIIETGKLSIQYSEISTGTFEHSTGQGGNLSIKASNVELIGGSIATAALGQGKGGDVQLQANSLNLNNGGSISSSSEGRGNAGNAGNILINLSDRLTSNRGIIAATSAQTGGGDINITADDIRLSNSSVISSSVFDSTGGGGNITIKSTVFLALDDSDILANADAGPGGNIKINSPAFVANLFTQGQAVAVGRNPGDLARFRRNGQVDISDDFVVFAGNSRTDISTTSVSNTSGSIIIPDLISSRGLAQLPSNFVDASELIDRRCTPKSSAQRSSFTITGRGGLPPNPNESLQGENVITNWVTLDDQEEKSDNHSGMLRDRTNHPININPNPVSATPKQLVEAQSWVIDSDGQVILTAQANTATPQTPGIKLPSCPDAAQSEGVLR